jgi:hypothetical protein
MAHAGGFDTEKLACKVATLGVFSYGVFESRFAKMLCKTKKKRSDQNVDVPNGKSPKCDRLVLDADRGDSIRGTADQVRRRY